MTDPNTNPSGLFISDLEEVAAAFNEWMRRYTEEPEAFEREWQTVGDFLKQQAAGEEPDYGAWCAAYLQSLIPDAAT